MIPIVEQSMSYYIKRLQSGVPFAFVGYSDAEWYSIIRHDLGRNTGLGQVLDADAGDRLLDVLRRRWRDDRFLFAVPKCLWTREDCQTAGIGHRIESLLRNVGVWPTFFERDMVLDDLAAQMGGLRPLVRQLRGMPTAVISSGALRPLKPGVVDYRFFVEIASPNFHLDPHGPERVLETVQRHGFGDGMVFLVSAGIGAATIIDRLYAARHDNFYIDCGSIWDAFVGIGGQRMWRDLLYQDPERWEHWKHANLCEEPRA